MNGVTSSIAVIGDVHGNTGALVAAIEAAHGADRVVLLGDLLTYGPDVDAVIGAVERTLESRDTVLLRGNHDQLYEDLDAAETEIERRPEWFRESVAYVTDRLDVGRFRRLPWRDACTTGSVFFAHANPFGTHDWSYLSSAEDHSRAVTSLRDRRTGLGVFGHTHRARCYRDLASGYRLDRPAGVFSATWDELQQRPAVINAGAIGQPRDDHTIIYVVWLTLSKDGCSVDFVPVSYDVERHLDALSRAPLSEATRRRLIAFHLGH